MTKSRSWTIGDFVFVEVDAERKLSIKTSLMRVVARLERNKASNYRKAGWVILTQIIGVPVSSMAAKFATANEAAKWFVSPDGQREFVRAIEEDNIQQDRYDDYYDEYVCSGDAYRDAARWQAQSNGGLY